MARGGLRWSDRPEDFRTEILGLVKAQMVKNTIIVPVGSKGGFVLKRAPSPADREAYMKEGVECYQDYLRGLLDLTDNRVQGRIEPPPQVRRHDEDDPYLVVAADKGTATFSDYANAISKEYGFWLGDAFASGGSAGYDHKAMGITARGAWESVKRRFREMGVNTQTIDFTVAGVGDMSGDVFGNGMLLSRHIKLVAAFDHRHIFLDPDPDTETSFEERERLFNLPRSSWADYDSSLISAGGGVYPRTAKSIPLSPEARRALGVEADEMHAERTDQRDSQGAGDLLYNGGIGTYVKSSKERNAEVGDRANDAVRVNGADLRCKVIAEGGNLGFTQLGRVEYALAGGRINTDAIDNSAGVSTSDHEVNIKILLGIVMADGEMTEKQRNTLLAQMTDEVAKLVLRDNYTQTQWLSVSGHLASLLLDPQQRFIRFLEKKGRLNRQLEFLPSDEEIGERRAKQTGLTTPGERGLARLQQDLALRRVARLLAPRRPVGGVGASRVLPAGAARAVFRLMPRHPLKREIIATHVTNSMLNRVGGTFVHYIMEITGFSPAEIVRAYLLAREVFVLAPLWKEIEALDNKVGDRVQAEMVIEADRLIVRATAWFLRSRRLTEDMAVVISHFSRGSGSARAAIARRARRRGPRAGAIARREVKGERRARIHGASGGEPRRAVRGARHRRSGRDERAEGRTRCRSLFRPRHPTRVAGVARANQRFARRQALAGDGPQRHARRPRGLAKRHHRRSDQRLWRWRLARCPGRRVAVTQPARYRTHATTPGRTQERALDGRFNDLGRAARTAPPRVTAKKRSTVSTPGGSVDIIRCFGPRRWRISAVVSPRPIAWIMGKGGKNERALPYPGRLTYSMSPGYIPLIRGVGIAPL